MLINWIEVVSRSQVVRLMWNDYDQWKNFLYSRSFKHEEYCGALLYAAKRIVNLELRRDDSVTFDVEDGTDGNNDEITNKNIGIVTGMPLTIVSWNEIDMSVLERMSTMMVRSSILQACRVLKKLGDESSILEAKRVMDQALARALRVLNDA